MVFCSNFYYVINLFTVSALKNNNIEKHFQANTRFYGMYLCQLWPSGALKMLLQVFKDYCLVSNTFK